MDGKATYNVTGWAVRAVTGVTPLRSTAVFAPRSSLLARRAAGTKGARSEERGAVMPPAHGLTTNRIGLPSFLASFSTPRATSSRGMTSLIDRETSRRL